jgi:hypothetical protein
MLVKLLLTTSLLFSLSSASGTYDGVYFTDYEENASLHFTNYYPYSDFLNLGITSQDSSKIITSRPSLQ